jgi:asparagine synthetase B (glutamine-hydrolysing)
VIDSILVHQIDMMSHEEHVAVLLSGGVDSVSVAFAAHRLGKKITAYTFHLDGQPTYDSQKAVDIAKIMGWDYRVVVVPTDNVEQDFIRLAKDVHCEKKTHFECCFPFLYVYPQIKEHEVLSGWAADGYYGVSKKANIHYKHTKEKFDEFRKDYFGANSRAGYVWHKRVAEELNKKRFIAPYLDLDVAKFFMSKDWYELNQPYQKHHVVEAFPEFKQVGGVKKHINLQLGSGIDKLFEKEVLSNMKLNFNNRKRVMDVCRDWVKPSDVSLEDFFT